MENQIFSRLPRLGNIILTDEDGWGFVHYEVGTLITGFVSQKEATEKLREYNAQYIETSEQARAEAEASWTGGI